jgi:hypothetical protein
MLSADVGQWLLGTNLGQGQVDAEHEIITACAHVGVGECSLGSISGLLDQISGHAAELIVCLLAHPAELQLERLLLVMNAVQAAGSGTGKHLALLRYMLQGWCVA